VEWVGKALFGFLGRSWRRFWRRALPGHVGRGMEIKRISSAQKRVVVSHRLEPLPYPIEPRSVEGLNLAL